MRLCTTTITINCSFPFFSAGNLAVPKDLVANAAYEALLQYDAEILRGKVSHLRSLHFVNVDAETSEAFARVFKQRQVGTGPDQSDVGVLADVGLPDEQPGQGSFKLPSVMESFVRKKRTRILKRRVSSSENLTVIADNIDIDDASASKKSRASDSGDGLPQSSSSTLAPSPGESVQDLQSKGEPVKDLSGATKNDEASVDEDCVICMCPMTDPKQLSCGHKFCADCIGQYFDKCQPKCPSCGKLFGVMKGNQPPGMRTVKIVPQSLAGYSDCDTIRIEYDIPDGIQTVRHHCSVCLIQTDSAAKMFGFYLHFSTATEGR